VDDPAFFYSTIPAEFTNSRLIGRSVWNSQWKIVIPAYTLLNNEQEGLNRFTASVSNWLDIQLFLRTYSRALTVNPPQGRLPTTPPPRP
jgi:hypothetical protein